MLRLWRLLALLALAPAAAAQPLAAAAAPEAPAEATPEAEIRAALGAGGWHEGTAALYAARGYAPLWTERGALWRLMARLEDARADGLAPEAVRLGDIRAASGVTRDALVTDGVLRLADALAGRRVDPERVHAGHWHLTREVRRRRAQDLGGDLDDALASGGAPAVLAWLDSLQPPHPEYHALRARLAEIYRLDAAAVLPAPTRFPESAAAIPDAPRQRPLSAEAARIALNLERWRWLPRDLGAAHVLVNVPGARLWLRERAPEASGVARGAYAGSAYETVLDMAATVGQTEPDWQTPVISDPIRSVQFFPTWTPTVTIQRREIIPQAREDGGAELHRRGFDVFRGRQRLDPREVDWRRARAGQYRITQRGGPLGELGRVKFVMPNRHWILIHDTHTPEEFDRPERALSHGCVRAEDPEALADAVLTRTNGWDATRASGLLRGAPRTRGVRLRRRFPVHIVYFTAWPTASGVTFPEDLYGRDAELAAALGIDLREGEGAK